MIAGIIITHILKGILLIQEQDISNTGFPDEEQKLFR